MPELERREYYKFEDFKSSAILKAKRMALKSSLCDFDRDALCSTALFACWMALRKVDRRRAPEEIRKYVDRRIFGAICDDMRKMTEQNSVRRWQNHRRNNAKRENRKFDEEDICVHGTDITDRIPSNSPSGLDSVDNADELEFALTLIEDDLDRKVTIDRFIGEKYNYEIAKDNGVSASRVSQRIERAFSDIRRKTGET